MTRIRLDDDRPPYPELAHAVLALLEMLDRLTVSLICQEFGADSRCSDPTGGASTDTRNS